MLYAINGKRDRLIPLKKLTGGGYQSDANLERIAVGDAGRYEYPSGHPFGHLRMFGQRIPLDAVRVGWVGWDGHAALVGLVERGMGFHPIPRDWEAAWKWLRANFPEEARKFKGWGYSQERCLKMFWRTSHLPERLR